MKLNEQQDVYKYIAVYLNDLATAMVDPQPFIDILMDKYHFKFKGIGPLSFHLDVTLCATLTAQYACQPTDT